MKFVDGIAFPDADEFMARELQRTRGRYQFDHLDAALKHVTNFDLAIDGGAHVGLWTRQLAKVFQQVIAVEPSEDTCEALRENVRRWGLANVETSRVALGDKPGMVGMTLDPAQEARKNTGGRYVAPSGTIAQVAIDSRRIPSLGFLKLDVEGSEYFALSGARETLARCRPIVLFEEKHLGNKYYGLAAGLTQALLTQAGYALLARVGCDEIWGPA